MELLLSTAARCVVLAIQAVAILVVVIGSARVVAGVRTFLSYFLDREIEQTAKLLAVKRSTLGAAASPRGD